MLPIRAMRNTQAIRRLAGAAIAVLAAAGLMLPAAPARASGQHHNNFYFRVGVTRLTPHTKSSPVTLSGVSKIAGLALSDGPIAGSGATVPPMTTPSVTIGYVLPWMHRHLAAETILAPPLTAKFVATGTLRYQSLAPNVFGVPTGIPALGKNIGETKTLPPLVTLVYRFGPRYAVVPYVGAGVTYIYTYDSKVTNPILEELRTPVFEVSNTWGWVAQVGVHTRFWHSWYATLDAKYIGDATVTGTVKGVALDSAFGPVSVGTSKATVTLNPLVLQAGVGFNF